MILAKRLDSSTIWRYFIGVAVTALAAGCGGSGGSPEGNPNPPVIPEVTIQAVEVSVGGGPETIYTNFSEKILINDGGIYVAATEIRFDLVLDTIDTSIACSVAGVAMSSPTEGRFSAVILPAYFEETIQLECQFDGVSVATQSVDLVAADPDLEEVLNYYIDRIVLSADLDHPEDPYAGYRRQSYYSEIQRFIMAAEIYSDPERFGFSTESSEYKKIELYLLNSSESYFEPCVGYDFDNDEPRQCRSQQRRGPYYLWRSPTAESGSLRTAHAKEEWRAAGGIAQAIKAILIAHQSDGYSECPVSDDPSEIIESNVFCRALNVRRLLYDEVWAKWSDEQWVAQLGYPHEFTIDGANVSHYISWIELIADLFRSTSLISNENPCLDCNELASVGSGVDSLLRHFQIFGDDYITITCKPVGTGGTCNFIGNPMEEAGAVDLSHLGTVIHLVTMYGQENVCTSDNRQCFAIEALARTMNDKTWIDSIENTGTTVGFPKFDIFFNGYCSQVYLDTSDPLNDLCVNYWLTEAGNWPSHKNLFGLQNLGKYNRDLMIKIRLAADENHDGSLDRNDAFLHAFSVMLYGAIASNGEPF